MKMVLSLETYSMEAAGNGGQSSDSTEGRAVLIVENVPCEGRYTVFSTLEYKTQEGSFG